ncbi:MAG: histidine kinase dimerization/phosphoacceptor domain -containing protein [Ignavibacteria bacterium]
MKNQFFFKRDVYTAEIFQDFSIGNINSDCIPAQMNESAILLFSLDTNGNIMLLEGKILNLLEIDKKEILGTSIFDTDSRRHTILNSIKNAITNKLSTSIFEFGDYVFQIYYTSIKELNGRISGIIGSAIDITEQRKNDQIIKKKNEQISLLYEAGKKLSSTLNINLLYDTMLGIISKAAECDTLFVASYDKKENLIKYTYLRDRVIGETIDTSKIPPIPLAPAGYGIISNVVRTGKAVILNDYQKELKKVKISFNVSLDIESQKKSDSDHKVGSAIIVPITVDNEIIGVVQIFSAKVNAYTREQLSFIEALMQPIGLAINNAILYQNAQNEIKERKFTEIKISHSLHEKELLLKEVHHRVKNNLQIIKSLVSIQSRYIKDKTLLRFFNESKDMIQTVAFIHELLYQGDDIARINFSQYFMKLTSYLLSSLEVRQDQHNLSIDDSNVNMSIDIAIPCGLIINELFSNSIKHAFPGGKKGNIYMKLGHENNDENGNYELIIKDDGVGLPDGFVLDHSNHSLGMKIVYNLIRQINGEVEIKKDSGTEFIIKFPPANYKNRV